MPAYRNGEVPDSLLVTFASGWLPEEGQWKHQLPPSTYRKHLALVALAKRNTGRVLKPTAGWSCYRPRPVQVYAKKIHGIFAATPGTSSHGLFWEGRQCAAIDYGNWGEVYGGDRAAFYRDVRAVGLEPGLIEPRRGYPDEPWHVVDLDPWAPAPAGLPVEPTAPVSPDDESEEDEMKPFLIWKKNPNGTRQWALISGDLSRMIPIWKLTTANALGKLYGAATEVVESEWAGFVNASEIEVTLIAATEPA